TIYIRQTIESMLVKACGGAIRVRISWSGSIPRRNEPSLVRNTENIPLAAGLKLRLSLPQSATRRKNSMRFRSVGGGGRRHCPYQTTSRQPPGLDGLNTARYRWVYPESSELRQSECGYQ